MTLWRRISYFLSLNILSAVSSRGVKREKTVLLAAPLFLGDLCMALPAISRMQVARPDCKFVLIVRPELIELCASLRGPLQVIPFEKNSAFITRIRDERAECGVCFFQERFVEIFKKLRVPQVICLSELAKPNREGESLLPVPDLLMKLAVRFSGTNTTPQQPDQGVVPWRPMPIPQRTLPAKYAVIHCDGRSQFKTLPNWLIDEILEQLEKRNISGILTGQWVDKSTQLTYRFMDFRGQTSLHDALAICQRACCVFGPDTGVTHFSASNKVPTWVALGPSRSVRYGESALISSRAVWGLPDLDCRVDDALHGIDLLRQINCKGDECRNKIRGFCLSEVHRASARRAICSGSLIPDSPLSGRLPLEGDCLDEETTFIFPGVQTGSCGDGTGSRVFLS
jgi:ADP-heptose:LPS heptosyltransferase